MEKILHPLSHPLRPTSLHHLSVHRRRHTLHILLDLPCRVYLVFYYLFIFFCLTTWSIFRPRFITFFSGILVRLWLRSSFYMLWSILRIMTVVMIRCIF